MSQYVIALSADAVAMLHRLVMLGIGTGDSSTAKGLKNTVSAVYATVKKHRAQQIAGEVVADGKEKQRARGGKVPEVVVPK